MKSLLFYCVMLLVALPLKAQLRYETVKDTLPTYQYVVKADSISGSHLYSMLKLWTAINYKSAKNVVQLDDKDAGRVIIKAKHEYSYIVHSKALLTSVDVPIINYIDYTLAMEAKNNRFRVTLTLESITSNNYPASIEYYLGTINNNKIKGMEIHRINFYSEVAKLKHSIVQSLCNMKTTEQDSW